MIKKSTSWTVLIYGIVILTLGSFAYVNSGSAASLYSGVGFGSLLILCAILMFYNIHFGSFAALFLTLALTVTFAIRYSLTHKQTPAILAVLSASLLLFLLPRILKKKE